MNCNNCGKTLPKEAIYCPFCGKKQKEPSAPSVKTNKLLPILPFDKFKEQFEQIKGMDITDVFAWFHGVQPSFEVFEIVGHFYWFTKQYGQDEERRWLTLSLLDEWLSRDEFDPIDIKISKKYLTNSMLNNRKDIGERFFFDAISAKEAVSDVLSRHQKDLEKKHHASPIKVEVESS